MIIMIIGFGFGFLWCLCGVYSTQLTWKWLYTNTDYSDPLEDISFVKAIIFGPIVALLALLVYITGKQEARRKLAIKAAERCLKD